MNLKQQKGRKEGWTEGKTRGKKEGKKEERQAKLCLERDGFGGRLFGKSGIERNSQCGY